MRKLISRLRKVSEDALGNLDANVSEVGQLDLSNVDVVLHIGSPKTGSSALQNYCRKNTKFLLSQGVYYPEHDLDSNGVSGGHWDLAQHIVSGDLDLAKNIFSGYLKLAKAKNSTLLISAESFFIRPKAVLEVIGDCKFHVVGFFRHPLEAFQSHYNQGVKRHFSTAKIRDVAASDQVLRPGITGESVLEWLDLVGDSALSILPYSNSKKNHFDTPKAFMSLLGINYIPPELRLINNSYSQSALELKRLLNSVLNPDDVVMNSRLDLELQQYSDRLNVGGPSLKDLLGESLFLDLKEKYDPIVARIKKNLSVEIPYSEPVSDGIYFDSPDMVWNELSNNADLYRYLMKCVYGHINAGLRSYDLVRLAEWVGLDFESLEMMGGTAGLTDKEIFDAINPKAQKADMLRELAKMLERSGKAESALKVAKKALELRPKGPYLQALVKRLSDNTNNEVEEI